MNKGDTMDRFKIKLGEVHKKSGMSRYLVAKKTGLSYNTVGKYVSVPEIIVDYIPSTVLKLTEFYGVDWRDPAIIEVIEAENAVEE